MILKRALSLCVTLFSAQVSFRPGKIYWSGKSWMSQQIKICNFTVNFIALIIIIIILHLILLISFAKNITHFHKDWILVTAWVHWPRSCKSGFRILHPTNKKNVFTQNYSNFHKLWNRYKSTKKITKSHNSKKIANLIQHQDFKSRK